MLVTLLGLAADRRRRRPAPGATAPEQPQIDTGLLVTLLLHTPLFLMFWHAPALVHWHGITPAKSLFFSVVACWRNLGALLVYGLAWMGVFLLVGTVLGLLGAVAGGTNLARAVMVPTALLMAAMFTSSIWFTFRDSFTADEALLRPRPPQTAGDPAAQQRSSELLGEAQVNG